MRIDGKTGLITLIGDPVEHSLSPFIHNTALQEMEKNYVYLSVRCGKDNLPDMIKSLKTIKALGGNVTYPLKEEIIPYLDEIDPLCKKIGAVNCFKIKNGKIKGYNTDGMGFLRTLDNYDIDYKNMSVMILGAGGAGSAIATALCDAGCRMLYIKGRTTKKPQRLSEKIKKNIKDANIQIIDKDITLKEGINKSSLLINATNIGMDEDASPIDDDIKFSEKMTVYDIIYHPKKTRLMKNAEKQGKKTYNGIDMLISQANLSFEIWTGKMFDSDVIKGKMSEVFC